MLFNSFQFLLFFPIVTLLYWIIPYKLRWIHLLIASCIFYMAFIPVYILILFFTIIIDYVAGIFIEKSTGRKRKRFLIMSIIANVGILAFFKYYNFFIDNINDLLRYAHIATHPLPLLNIILPIGLSFHTFQAMSYTIEVYRGNQRAERHLGIYALYVMFYPQLVAGPIERPQNLLPQFHTKQIFNVYTFFDGLRLMLWGLFKKIIIADRLAIYVSAVYTHPGNFHYLNLIIATIFFAIQIYCDFSGYSDIAIGAAKAMGYNLMTNFNRPYFAKNIQAFWARWHISLSTWFRDYVYISLGGNRIGVKHRYINLAIVFLISGLWHGANWTFVVWGALHAVFVILFMLRKQYIRPSMPSSPISDIAGIVFTFSLVSFAWIFFRASNIHDAILIIKHIVTAQHPTSFQLMVTNIDTRTEFGPISIAIAACMTIGMFIYERFFSPSLTELTMKPILDIALCSLILTCIICFGIFYNTSFIYFQF